MTEPTDDDRTKAARLLKSHRVISMDVGLDRAIAAALAAERAAAVADLRARVEAVAEELDLRARAKSTHPMPGYDEGYRQGLSDGESYAADLLRAAVTDTTGDPA